MIKLDNPQEKDKMQIMLRDTCSKNKIISRLDIESHRQTLVHSKEDKNKKALTSTYLSRSITSSQCGVCGKRSTAIAFTGWKASEMGMDLARCRARPAMLLFLHPLLSFFTFSLVAGEGVQSSIAFATKVSGLQDM